MFIISCTRTSQCSNKCANPLNTSPNLFLECLEMRLICKAAVKTPRTGTANTISGFAFQYNSKQDYESRDWKVFSGRRAMEFPLLPKQRQKKKNQVSKDFAIEISHLAVLLSDKSSHLFSCIKQSATNALCEPVRLPGALPHFGLYRVLMQPFLWITSQLRTNT